MLHFWRNICVLWVFCGCFIFNKASSAELSVEHLLKIAEQNSQNIKAAEYFKNHQANLAIQQKYWNNPEIEFGTGEMDTAIRQTIPFYSKLQKKYQVENLEAGVLDTKQKNTLLLVKAEVFKLAYEYYGTAQKLELFEKRLERLNSVDKYLSNIVLTSPTKRSQAHIVKDKISLIRRDIIALRYNLLQIWNKINIFTQLSERPDLAVTWLNNKFLIDKDSLVKLAIDNNLDLKEQKQYIEKYKAELQFAKIEQMPDLTLSANKYANQSNSYGIGIGVSLPIINTNKYKISGLMLKIKAQENVYEFKKQEILQTLENHVIEYQSLIETSEILPVSRIKNALGKLSDADLDFKKGILDFITYIELDTQEYEVIDAVINTQVNLAITYADLMLVSGSFVLPKNE